MAGDIPLTGAAEVRKPDIERVGAIIQAVRDLAISYYEETGKPLGVTSEIAEYEAARLLSLDLCEARCPGYDAVRSNSPGPKRVQIKGRRLREASNPGQRVGRIKFDHEWDSVILVLLDDRYEAEEIYEAERDVIKQALSAPGSKARNDRGALGVRAFIRIGKRIWQR